ncbi:hypothetical protein JXB11_04710 [Candidatus Woesearchaeota archaeon]|nr:hypothetical protein [Candidatus Woesearchaeota archaeon]
MGKGIKKWALAIGIAIVLAMFVNYGIGTFYPGPEYEDYCRDEFARVVFPEGKLLENCTVIETPQSLKDSCQQEEGHIAYERDSFGCPTKAYCETCDRDYEADRKTHSGNAFIILVIAGLVCLALGIVLKVESVATGFLLGGILNILIGTIGYWDHLHQYLRFILLGIVLALLILLGYKKVRD